MNYVLLTGIVKVLEPNRFSLTITTIHESKVYTHDVFCKHRYASMDIKLGDWVAVEGMLENSAKIPKLSIVNVMNIVHI